MTKKSFDFKSFIYETFIVLIILILSAFLFVSISHAEVIAPAVTSLSGDGTNQVVRYDYITQGVNWNHLTMYNGTTMFMQSSFRMSNVNARYNVQFWILSPEAMPQVTLNGTPCQTNFNLQQWTNPGNYNANELILNNVYMVLCSNVPGNTQQFYVRVGNLKPLDGPRGYGIGKNIYIESYANETQALQNSITTMQNAITQNQTQNTNNIINSVNNMTNTLNQQQQQTNQKLDDINNTLNDSSVDGFNVDYNNNIGPISALITMPITLAQGYLTGLNSSCQPYNLGALYGTDLILPCINVSSWLGASLYNTIDVLFSGFMIYAIAKMFIRTYNKLTNLNNQAVEGELFSD